MKKLILIGTLIISSLGFSRPRGKVTPEQKIAIWLAKQKGPLPTLLGIESASEALVKEKVKKLKEEPELHCLFIQKNKTYFAYVAQDPKDPEVFYLIELYRNRMIGDAYTCGFL